jgi:DNA helicase-2/ATP-dependent DNA helicase PcrA
MRQSTSAVLSVNRVIIAAAGGGKTTRIVNEAATKSDLKTALVTYTQNNVREIESQLYRLGGAIPPHIEVHSWFRFLLRELARPYRNVLHNLRIEGLAWVEGRSAPYAKAAEVLKFYFSGGRLIYSDKIARFVCECDRLTDGAVMRRLGERFDHIYVDEVQDLAGYDLDILESILRAGIRLTLVGDHRQATYATNHSARHSAYAGAKIIGKFSEWAEAHLTQLTYEQESHRCQQAIVDLADMFFPNEPKTVSRNNLVTGHDGVFAIPAAFISNYVSRFQPQVLRLDRRTDCGEHFAMNFGESKGMTFERVLIYPHKSGVQWLSSGNIARVAGSAAKM